MSKPPDAPILRKAMFCGFPMLIRIVVRSMAWSPAACLDENAFRFPKYLGHCGSRMWSSDAMFLSFAELADRDLSSLDSIFVRADTDLKELTECEWPEREFNRFVERLRQSGDSGSFDLLVVVAAPEKIEYEWRVFVVGGRVSNGSQNRHWCDIEFTSALPAEAVAFAGETARSWSPARACVIAAASVESTLSVIELNGFNSSDFYQPDIAKIVSDIDRE